jgi:N-acetylmuramoyl-L-alanine amidase
MKANLNRIFSIIFLVLATAAISWLGIRDLYKSQSAIINVPTEGQAVSVDETVTQVRDASETLKVEYPDDQSVTVRADSITVKGICDKALQLTVNGQAVAFGENGVFSVEVKLNIGENKLSISNGLVTYEYIVNYQLPLIKDCSPSKDIKADGISEIELSANCRKDSTVWAVIDGEKIPLYAYNTESNEEFVSYSAKFKLPAASAVDKNLGKVQFFAEYGEYKDSVSGGSIIVKAYKLNDIVIEQGQGQIVNPEITSGDIVNVLSANTDHGKGKAMMYVVKADFAESVPASTDNDFNDPKYTPQIKGTIDYITGEYDYTEKDSGEVKHYWLTLSGAKIEKKKTESFEGYILPSNTVQTYKTYTANGYTNVILTMNWKVPFYSEMKNQSYYTGFAGKKFNVSSFTASYIDFTFHYTNAAQGSFDFSSSTVVNGAEWVNIGEKGTSTLRVYFRNSGRFYGYKAYFASDNRLVIQFKERPDIQSPVVVLDAGHGGKDCGAIGTNGVYEKDINFRITAYVKSNLEAAGYRVLVTRTNDTNISKDDRQALGKSMGGDIFVSIHNNSNPTSPSLCGPELYYYRANSQPLAKSIHSALIPTWRDIYADKPDMSSRMIPSDGGVRYGSYRMIRNEECPSVLVECGYLSNSVEVEMLCRNDVQQRIAKAISDGIINYFNGL